MVNAVFSKGRYLFRKKFWRIFGEAFYVYDEEKNPIMYSEMKAFRLREDFRIYDGVEKNNELLVIKTPQIIDFSATYFVFDPLTQERVGALKRKGLKSLFKDEWKIFANEQEIATLTETSWLAAIVSRMLPIIPQSYIIKDGEDNVVATIKQHFNPFILKYTMDIKPEYSSVDSRLLLAAGIMIIGIEGRQDDGSWD